MLPDPARTTPDFARLLAPFDDGTLDVSSSATCGVGADLRIGYVNPAWRAFAVANGARAPDETCGLHVDILSVVPLVLRPFHEALFARARDTHEVTDHDYECSSANVHRTFRMRIHPCDSGAFVVVHSLLREVPHVARAFDALEATYRDGHGLIAQCSNCRHVRRARLQGGTIAVWDWVPAYVADVPLRVSHGICEVCSAFYYA